MDCAMLNSHHPYPHNLSPSNFEPYYYHHHASPSPYQPGYHSSSAGQQLAYPLRGDHIPHSENITSDPRGTSLPVAENMLRRKTPNGTLNGAYESNAHDAQALKHMLLPRNDSLQRVPPQLPQMDSMLHQIPYMQHMPAHVFHGQTVPSVLQPPFQQPGPTASGIDGRGPYGPYWNDGTYIPYRPAALRDSRFYGGQQIDARWGGNIGYGRMSSWQNEPLVPLVYPSSSTRGSTWSLTHGGVAVPYPYTPPAGPGLVQESTLFHDVPEYGPGPANSQQRERVFHWALQIYRDFLAYIHHVKRQKQRTGQPQTTQTRPNFFPKPPKLSGVPFPSSSNPPDRKTDDSTPRPGQTGPSYPPADTQYNESRRAISGPACQTAAHDHNPGTRAVDALTVISGLCQETDWQWVDGMHLGGCLAYGLGNYSKAQRWYNKVLELDPKHLEAMSNLAATLVLLHQKDEAEHHWKKVIRNAPNHFEAVEHLVGLLCQTQRAKDAVKVIDYVERSLRIAGKHEPHKTYDHQSDCSMSNASTSPCLSDASDRAYHEFDTEYDYFSKDPAGSTEPGFGTSGYAIPGCDNGRILSLIHAKGNMLYSLGDNTGAAKAFEDAVLLATGRQFNSIQELVRHVLSAISAYASPDIIGPQAQQQLDSREPILLYPDQAAQTARLCFPHHGELAGLRYIPPAPLSVTKNTAVATTSNSLLSLAKIFQDNMSASSQSPDKKMIGGVRDILALYYLSLSLLPSPSTANNVGILLAGVQQTAPIAKSISQHRYTHQTIPGVKPGSGIALALAYYNHGLQLDKKHAHLYTNLGSLLKDIGQLDAAIEMYKSAVQCDAKFDIALANLANAVKDKGRISDAIEYYKRAVEVNPDFTEAVCGLGNALNSVCNWRARGGIASHDGKRDRWHVDEHGMLVDGSKPGIVSSGWIKRVVQIVEKQLDDGEDWGKGVLTPSIIEAMVRYMTISEGDANHIRQREQRLRRALESWTGRKWEGARITRLVERATRRITWHWYQDIHVRKRARPSSSYLRPQLPVALSVPSAPTVLPFHTFTCPMSAKQVRLISQRNGYRLSASTLRMPWLQPTVYRPPAPPAPFLKVGYVSSDFNNHPLAHLMQSVFGMHNPSRVQAICYATTASDGSIHRHQIETEAPVFYDVSSWSSEKLVNKIVDDGCHILVNLNGYTRGARNEVFAARPAPIQMSFMGFAGTLGAEWCDYLLADHTAVPPTTLRPWRRNVDIEDALMDENDGSSEETRQTVTKEQEGWVYGENIIYCRDTFFCCDHKQSAPDAGDKILSWEEEQKRRWAMRQEIFPTLADDTVIFGNFNQLYKIDPTTFRTWLRILSAVPNSILWLLRFPDLGESHLLSTARLWAGSDVASRIIFTDVAPKHLHISRARVCDLFLDTPECNAHTTSADCLWSGTPLLTLPRWEYKMCSRMAASILKGALPKNPPELRRACERDLIASSEEEYEALAIRLGSSLHYPREGPEVGFGRGRLVDLRRILTEGRWTSALFDTHRWVRDLEDAMEVAWERWVNGVGGDIWLDEVPIGGRRQQVRDTRR